MLKITIHMESADSIFKIVHKRNVTFRAMKPEKAGSFMK